VSRCGLLMLTNHENQTYERGYRIIIFFFFFCNRIVVVLVV